MAHQMIHIVKMMVVAVIVIIVDVFILVVVAVAFTPSLLSRLLAHIIKIPSTRHLYMRGTISGINMIQEKNSRGYVSKIVKGGEVGGRGAVIRVICAQ